MQRQPLWQRYFDRMREMGVTSDVRGRDRARIETLLAELYRLGERPSRREVRDYLSARDGTITPHARALLDLWSKRLRNPHGTWRTRDSGYAWKYPFVFAEQDLAEHEEKISTRLADQVESAAHEYAVAIETESGTDKAEAAEDELRAATHCLIVWGMVQDRADDDAWYGPGVIFPRRSRSDRMIRATRRGRLRYDEWIERLRRAHAEEIARLREEHGSDG